METTTKEEYDETALQAEMERLKEEAIDQRFDDDLEEMYDNMLDECYPVSAGGNPTSYPASYVLKEVDPVAYRCGMNDYEDSWRRDLDDEIAIEDYRDEALENLDMADEE